jgi:PGF-CTERM protein
MSQLRSVGVVFIACIAISAITIGGGLAATTASSQGPPPLPGNYYPTVSLADGELDSPILVEAIADGEVQSSLITNASGGHDRTSMEVQKPESNTVSFRVGGSAVVRTVEWSPGPQEISLEVAADEIERNIDLSIADRSSPVTAGQEASVTAAITNTGGIQETRQVSLLDRQNTTLDEQEATVPIGETVESELTFDTDQDSSGDRGVTVAVGNESAQAIIAIEAAESDEDENSTDEESGSGGGGGGAGGSAGGGGGTTTSNGSEAAPTIQDIQSTLSLVEPTSSELPLIIDSSTSGIVVEPAGYSSVERIEFNNGALTGSVSIDEYPTLPTIQNRVRDSINDDIEGERNITVHSVLDISPTVNATEDSSAKVRLSVDRDKVSSPDQLTVFKQSYSQEAQAYRWKQIDPTVNTVNNQSVTIDVQVDSFSLFVIADSSAIEDGESEGTTQTNNTDESTGQEDSTATDSGVPGFGVITAVLAIVSGLLILRRQG